MVLGANGINGAGFGSILIAGLLIAGATIVGRRRQQGDRP